MMRLKLDNGDRIGVATWNTAAEIVEKAAEYVKRWHFKAARDLDTGMLLFGRDRFYFKRDEGWGVSADIHFSMVQVARFPGIQNAEDEPLRLFMPTVETNWSSTTHSPARALAAANVHLAAAEAACGLIPYLDGLGYAGGTAWPSWDLGGRETKKLEDLLVERIGDTV